jgi:Fe2+ or Zn2+ uptake regulation protein
MVRPDIDEQLIAKLRERGLRVTSQRVVIHRVLCSQARHMTAEQVLESVADSLPGTSLPTVYATLELLEELGLVRRLRTGSGAVLFDSRLDPHAHTVCRQCGATTDLENAPASPRIVDRARRTGFVAEHTELVIWGLCARCATAAAA